MIVEENLPILQASQVLSNAERLKIIVHLNMDQHFAHEAPIRGPPVEEFLELNLDEVDDFDQSQAW